MIADLYLLCVDVPTNKFSFSQLFTSQRSRPGSNLRIDNQIDRNRQLFQNLRCGIQRLLPLVEFLVSRWVLNNIKFVSEIMKSILL